jgi:hypothetical protein
MADIAKLKSTQPPKLSFEGVRAHELEGSLDLPEPSQVWSHSPVRATQRPSVRNATDVGDVASHEHRLIRSSPVYVVDGRLLIGDLRRV